MDTLKFFAKASAQVILLAGYYPVYRVILALWKALKESKAETVEVYKKNNADNDSRRDLSMAQALAMDKLADNVREMERQMAELRRSSYVAK